MNSSYGERTVIPGSLVVDTVTGRTAEVHQVLPKFGVQVWVRERGYERENWPWAMVTIRYPRLIKRYPRPVRTPREKPSQHCHCRIGRMEVESVEKRAVRCQRCKNLIGSESYPRRVKRATDMLRKADSKLSSLQKSDKLQKRVRKRSDRKAAHRSSAARKKGKRSAGSVVIRHKGARNAKGKARKVGKRGKPKNKKVSKTRRRQQETLSKTSPVSPTQKEYIKELMLPQKPRREVKVETKKEETQAVQSSTNVRESVAEAADKQKAS